MNTKKNLFILIFILHSHFIFAQMQISEEDSLYKSYCTKYASLHETKNFDTIWKHAEYFIPFISEKIREAKLPDEILYIPLIESEFKPNAVSKSGAVGLWQFMPNSIEGYNITVNEWIDERMDFWKTTDAAIAKLKYNYSVLGDWNLAIAAYNCGLGRMQKAIRKGNTKNYWKLCEKGLLSKETTHYIPKLLAVAHTMKNRTVKPFEWTRIDLETSVDIRLLAKKAGISEDILSLGNSELKYHVTPPAKTGYRLKVPAEYAKKIKSVADGQGAELTDFKIYTVKAGDTISHLSQHYGVHTSIIESLNNISPNRLKIGTKLLIPVSNPDIETYQGTFSATEWRPVETADDFASEYKVQQGDSLWSIAKLFKTDVQHLAYFNDIQLDTVLSIGRVLKVPTQQNQLD